ncbi:MAG: catalase [Myxococcales bacterium]|nr:catalase [Myxococcales bacterium]
MDERKEALTTNQGVRVGDNQNSLKAGERGPTLLEDFILREKITHFDHERIPERVVHARGAGAHGTFQPYASLAKYTKAGFLQDPGKKTRVFVRFSTVAGSRGSADAARDARGFATKFYTEEGVFDLVGNNIPVFFIQDAMKFPDLIHAVKPEPHHEIPQAASAHDTFWDFVSLTPESAHMLLWVMSDRAIPRSLRMMEGFGVNTFRLVNAEGVSRLVKFHWKPLLGVHSLVWDEAVKLNGADPDFHRRDLWEAIDRGAYPEWELGIQLLPEDASPDELGFDPLDPTKVWPEQVVPVERVGKLTLDRNPDNFFAETEQVAFCPSHVVPGIDFSNDPLLQGRLFSYLDTQLSRLGSSNFAELPINRPDNPVVNNQRDGHMRHAKQAGRVSYQPNSLAGGCPFQAGGRAGGFTSVAERIDAYKIRGRSPSFGDHYGQAALFWRSQSDAEKEHIVAAFRFELAKVESPAIRRRTVDLLTNVDAELATRVAEGLGLTVDDVDAANKRLHADWHKYGVTSPPSGARASYDGVLAPELSMAETVKDSVKTRKVAVLAADGVAGDDVEAFKAALTAEGAVVEVIAPTLAAVTTAEGKSLTPDRALPTVMSVLYDAVVVPGGPLGSSALEGEGGAVHFINEAFMHAKAIAATGAGVDLLLAASILGPGQRTDADLSALPGVVVERRADGLQAVTKRFIAAVAQHRHFGRKHVKRVPA